LAAQSLKLLLLFLRNGLGFAETVERSTGVVICPALATCLLGLVRRARLTTPLRIVGKR
jgi:hypothetical protein